MKQIVATTFALIFLTNALSAHAVSPLATELQTLIDNGRLPGAYAVTMCKGTSIEAATLGWQDVESNILLHEDSIFRLYSMSKPITSVAVMMLVEHGRVALNDPVSAFLPPFQDMQVYVSGGLSDMAVEAVNRPITIRDLLLHDSGIAYHFSGNTPVHQYYRKYGVMRDTPVGRTPEDGPPAQSLDELVQRIGDAPLLHHPGTQFHYSYSTTVLGAVIERVMGQDLETALRALLFTPLGMTETGFFISDEQLPRFTTLYTSTPQGVAAAERPTQSDYRDQSRLLDGGGALASTAADYLRFMRMLANGGELDGRRYLSEEAVRDLFTPQIWIGSDGPRRIGFGYGFAIGDEDSQARGGQPARTASWSGSGNTYFLVDPDSGVIALLMTHVLTSPDQSTLTADLRGILHEAVLRARTDGGTGCHKG